ncbi:MAG: hypothetical protein Q4G44_06180 [Alcaligenaceae bacterium]|nr:hypothetical protein [Alcaligenaceae bacterium]
MNTITKKMCDECGRFTTKIFRIYKGHKYCGTCYVREFKHQECSKCGQISRILKSHEIALCQQCENNQPCIRCGKKEYKIGKITIYGPTCSACSVYFRNPEPCEICGTLSKRLSTSKELGHNLRVCPKCITSNHATCQACHKYRKLQPKENGQLVCKKCYEIGEIICPECQELMPAGYGEKCESCYWQELLKKRIRMDCAALNSQVIIEHFDSFGEWLLTHTGEKKAAINIHRYFYFFLDIDRQWGEIPNYSGLLQHFSAAKLRLYQLPMKWMQETGLIELDIIAKKENSERNRIATLQNKLPPNSIERHLLDGYLKLLLKRLENSKTTLTSIRLALTPAVGLLFLKSATDEVGVFPTQETLNQYLSQKTGQKAAISGFIGYLCKQHNVDIALPSPDDPSLIKLKRRTLENELLHLMLCEHCTDTNKQKWLKTGLAYFHGLNQNMIKQALKNGVDESNGDLTVMLNDLEYWLPMPNWWRIKKPFTHN